MFLHTRCQLSRPLHPHRTGALPAHPTWALTCFQQCALVLHVPTHPLPAEPPPTPPTPLGPCPAHLPHTSAHLPATTCTSTPCSHTALPAALGSTPRPRVPPRTAARTAATPQAVGAAGEEAAGAHPTPRRHQRGRLSLNLNSSSALRAPACQRQRRGQVRGAEVEEVPEPTIQGCPAVPCCACALWCTPRPKPDL